MSQDQYSVDDYCISSVIALTLSSLYVNGYNQNFVLINNRVRSWCWKSWQVSDLSLWASLQRRASERGDI